MILVTGSAGYIGSEICSNFERLKIKYIGIDNIVYNKRWVMPMWTCIIIAANIVQYSIL